MFKIIKITNDELEVFIVINAVKNQEVARFDTYAEASQYVLSK
jgi:hypothetical protein